MVQVAAAIALSLSATPLNVEFTVNPAAKRDPIHPYIYGQFIEHLGRCIYGGIWAEMLEDRKFFHPITKKFDPYRSMLDTPYPDLKGSPWQLLKGDVEMVKQDPFVGKQTPLLKDGAAIQQARLGTVAGKEYVGYIWLNASAPNAKVTVKFDGGEKTLTPAVGSYKKATFKFKATKTTDDNVLGITVQGADVLVGTVSVMPGDNVRGMRKDTLEKLKELGGTIYRWPGGNFVSGYDWRDGIGDRDRRPTRGNPAWGGLEYNDFGTDEFLDFCKEIGADPLITVNTGLGDAYTAAQWVEYCNGSTKTIGGSWRAKNGRKAPYNVKTWCVGNEMWGDWQLGYMKLEHYAIKHNWVSEAMWKVDPSLVLVGSGDLGDPYAKDAQGRPDLNKSFTRGLLERSGDHMQLISEHFYSGRLPWTKTERFPLKQAVKQMAENVKGKAEGHRKLQPQLKNLKGKIVPIAMDEWNYWHREYVYGELGCEYDLADALGIAAGLHEFYRNTDVITLATYAQTVNVIGALKTTRTAAELESTGLVLQVYRHKFEKNPIDVQGDFGDLDISAAISDDGNTVTIGWVNPNGSPVALKPNLPGFDLAKAKAYAISGAEETSKNSPGKPRQVDIVELTGTTVPRLSCGVIVLKK